MSYPIWVTTAGELGIIPQSEYFELVLQAYNDGDGFGARAVVAAVTNLPPYNRENIGIISQITILDGGTGYPNGYINVQAEGGVGFAGYALVTDGRVVDITITNGGYGYSVEQTSIVFNKNLEFRHIAGELPAGMYVTKIGTIQGSPIVLSADQIDKQFLFAVRATNTLTGKSADRSFSLTVSNITPPVIVQNQEYIGNYFDGSYFSFQLLVNDPIPGSNITYSIASGSLPEGLTLNADGLISGYITPLTDLAYTGIIYYDNAPYSEIGYDSIGKYRNDTYFFSVHVNNGITFGIQNYKMKITSRGNWSADTAINIVNIGLVEVVALEGTHVRADSSNVYIPIITTPVQSLPDARSGANFSFKFDAYDPLYEDFKFSIGNLLLSGFDQNSSDVYGNSPAYDILAFPCVINNTTGLISIQGNNYDLIDDKANITITANSYYPAAATITSTYYVNNTEITYLYLNSANSVTQGDTISQPSTGASGTVYISSGGTTIRLLSVTGTFASNTGNVFVGNIDGLGNTGNTYIFRNGANTTSAVNSNVTSAITYPTVNIFNPAGNIELYANTIGFSGTLYANITVTQPSNPADYGVPYDSTRFDQSGSYLPLTITIDPDSGWLTGNVDPQVEVTRTYEFTVSAYKVRDPNIVSKEVTYYITVLGDINNSITWSTPQNLGLIDNGAISQLSIEAKGYVGGVEKQLVYEMINIGPLLQDWIDDNYSIGQSVLYQGFAYRALANIKKGNKNPANNVLWQKYTSGSSLPNGLKLLSNGYIVGRTSFQYFALDAGSTTIDKQKTTFDDTYWFTIRATTVDGGVTDYRTFFVRVNNYNRIPYENLYIKALPSLDQRKLFLSIVNNTDIFPSSLIYRIEDPWFGRAKDIRSLFLPGLSPNQLAEYMDAISTNHFIKRITFGNIRTARAVDQNFNTKYEVVYLDLLDPVLDQGRSPANSMDLTNLINPWYDKQGNAYSVFYPNSFDPTIYPGTNTYYGNMKSPIAEKLGFSHQGSLPEWMTSVQDDGTVIGFKHAVVLAYTVPGASKLIAYRLQTSGLEFNSIDFVIDRYDLDNSLSQNFDTVAGKFFQNKETTFDRISRLTKPKYSISYAVRGIPFQEINGKTVDYVQSIGGFDGVTSFRDGELVVFAQQELYNNIFIPNDGWNGVNNLGNYVVPGYLDRVSRSVNHTLITTATAGQNFIIVNNTTGIEIGFTVECGQYFNDATTVQRIEGNVIYLENMYSTVPIQSILFTIPEGMPINFAPINQRAGVWKIRLFDSPNTEAFVPISGSDFGSDTIGFDTKIYDLILGWVNAPPRPTQIVQLEFFAPVAYENHIQVNKGTSLSQSIIYYDPLVAYGYSVPAYTVLNSSLRPALAATRFDSYQTKFIDNRDTYAAPQINDKYIKFPKFGVFK